MRKLKQTAKPMAFLLGRMTRYPGLISLVVLTMALTTAGNILIPYLVKLIINNHILKGDIPGLLRMLVLLAAVYLTSVLSGYGNARVLVRVSQRLTRDLREEVFARMQDLPMGTFQQHTHGELMSTYTNDIDTISSFISSNLSGAIVSVLTFVGILIMLLIMSPVLTAVSCVFLAVQYLVMKKSGGLSRKGFVRQQQMLASLNGYIEEYTEGQKVVKLFGQERRAVDGFETRNRDLEEASYQAQIYAGIINPALGGIAEINNALTSTVGVVLVIIGHLDIGTLVAFIQYVQNAGHQIGALASLVNMVLAAMAGTERVMAALEWQPEPDTGSITRKDDHWSDGTPLTGRIVLNHLNFGYVSDHPVLRDITFTAEPGKKIALVGSTGAGKSTIANLLGRFYEVDRGMLSFDGIDLADIQKSALRSTLSMVMQDTHLFTGTVRENIRFGRLEATDQEVEQAAILANADFFIRHLPQGYDTVLTGDGSALSQGQRQLLAIARAAVADPAVLVLDEATSSIDTHTEQQIEAGMNWLMEGRTVFIIAHRLSTVRSCDTILVLEQGRIIEQGDHQSLLVRRGRYYDLYTGAAELD